MLEHLACSIQQRSTRPVSQDASEYMYTCRLKAFDLFIHLSRLLNNLPAIFAWYNLQVASSTCTSCSLKVT